MTGPKTVADRSKLLDRGEAEGVLRFAQPLLVRIQRRAALRARLAREIEVLQLLSDTSLRPGRELDEFIGKTVVSTDWVGKSTPSPTGWPGWARRFATATRAGSTSTVCDPTGWR